MLEGLRDLFGPAPVFSPTSPWNLSTIGYMAATFTAYMDSNLLAPNLTAAATFFGFDAEQRDAKLGGELAVGYFILATPLSLVAGHLADVMPRKPVFAACLALGKLPCLLTYFVTSYPQLFALRTLMGITIGTMTPLTASMAGDMFPVDSRTMGTATWLTCSTLGTIVGQYIAGMLGPVYGWKLPFLVCSLPGLVMSVLVLFCEEPVRGSQEEALKDQALGDGEVALSYVADDLSVLERVELIFTTPSNIFGFLQGLPGCVPWGVLNTYVIDYLSQDMSMSVQSATMVMSVFGFTVMCGNLFGGMLGQCIYNVWRPGLPLLMGATTILGTIPTMCIINFRYQQAWLLYGVAAIAGLIVSVTGANIRTVFLNVNSPDVRGTTSGIFCIMDDVGKGFGPFIATVLITSIGRLNAFNTCLMMWVPCGLLLGSIALTLQTDEHRLQRRLGTKAGVLPAKAQEADTAKKSL